MVQKSFRSILRKKSKTHLEFLGDTSVSREIVPIISRHGLDCIYTTPAEASNHNITLFFYSGNDELLDELLDRKPADMIILVYQSTARPAERFHALAAVCADAQNEYFEVARMVYSRFYQFRENRLPYLAAVFNKMMVPAFGAQASRGEADKSLS